MVRPLEHYACSRHVDIVIHIGEGNLGPHTKDVEGVHKNLLAGLSPHLLQEGLDVVLLQEGIGGSICTTWTVARTNSSLGGILALEEVVAEVLLPVSETQFLSPGLYELLHLGRDLNLVSLVLHHILIPVLLLHPLSNVGLGNPTMSRQDLGADFSPVLNIIGQGIIMVFLEFLWGVLLYIIIILFPFRVGHSFTKSGHTFTPFLEKIIVIYPQKGP